MKLFFMSAMILMLPSVIFAECRVVSYPDRDEVICEEAEKQQIKSNKQPIIESKTQEEILVEQCNKKTIEILALYQEQVALVSGKSSATAVSEKSSLAERLLTEIKLNSDRLYDDKYGYQRFCIQYQDQASRLLATMLVTSAKHYSDAGNKPEAKKRYREIIVRFTGDGYKSQVKAAEFGLEDLR